MKTVVVFSGGLDSTVLLNHLMRQGHDCHALSIDYGQRHGRELKAAQKVIRILNNGHCNSPLEKVAVNHEIADLSAIRHLLAGSSQTDDSVPVPHGHYADENMKKTVVPNRNMILLATATGYAVSIGAKAVAYGAHQGDHAIYPDCRPEFVAAMANVMGLCDYNPPALMAPFITISKADIAKLGASELAPMYASYSCYEGDVTHCGKCGTCVERREAFQLAGIADPTVYKGT